MNLSGSHAGEPEKAHGCAASWGSACAHGEEQPQSSVAGSSWSLGQGQRWSKRAVLQPGAVTEGSSLLAFFVLEAYAKTRWIK